MTKAHHIHYRNLALLALFLVLDINLIRSIWSVWGEGSVVAVEQKRLVQEKKKHADLEKELAYVKSPEYIEKEIREKLGLARPGEVVVLLPTPIPTPTVVVTPMVPIWKKWLEVFGK